MTARVVVAEAGAPTRAGLCLAVERGGLEVCAQVSNASALVAAATRGGADLVVLAIDLPGGALHAVEQVCRALPAARIIVLTAAEDEEEMLAAVLAGASGYLCKDVSVERLPQILRSVLAGEAAVPRRLSGHLLAEVRARHHRRRALDGALSAPLTDREWDMVHQLEEGRGTAEIARRLRISEVTVRRHISSLTAKLGVRGRRSAVALIRERSASRRPQSWLRE
jgi:DNA-binding NarL/FixJ family response regulator